MYPYNNDDFFERLEDDDDNMQRGFSSGGSGFPSGVGPSFTPGGSGFSPMGRPGFTPGGPGFTPGGPGFTPGGPGFLPGGGPGFTPGGPSFLPGGGPGFPGQPPFGGQPSGGQMTPPTAPPPSFTPQIASFQGTAEFSRRSGGRGIGRCFFRNTFIWMTNGDGFWFFPMFAFGNTIAGFRWRGNRGWVYDSINRNRILFFQCY